MKDRSEKDLSLLEVDDLHSSLAARVGLPNVLAGTVMEAEVDRV